MNYLIWGVIALVLSVLFGIFIIPMLREIKIRSRKYVRKARRGMQANQGRRQWAE